MSAEPYRFVDHTADLGLEIFGPDPAGLFANACFALFDNIVELSSVTGQSQARLTVTGADWADLMANWLRELLGRWTIKGRLIKSARIDEVSKTTLTATICFDIYDPARHSLKSDIKAVTYHNLTVEQDNDNWIARVVLDV